MTASETLTAARMRAAINQMPINCLTCKHMHAKSNNWCIKQTKDPMPEEGQLSKTVCHYWTPA